MPENDTTDENEDANFDYGMFKDNLFCIFYATYSFS